MSGQQKRGFRLPWAAERAPEEGVARTATVEPPPDRTSGVDGEDLGDGPFRRAGASPMSTEDPVPAASHVPEVTAEAAMIETQSTDSPAREDGTAAPAQTDWPEVDRRTSPQHSLDAERARPPIRAEGEARPPRRDNPLVAGLVKAMREAAIASRDETLARLHAEGEARVESIRTRATSEAAELRKRAENDVTDIREWSKAEIARIRQETEDRIEARRSELAGETERHAASVERLVGDVQTVVEAFEADMDAFFQRLLAEDDPARLAALAEQAPDAPDLTGDGPAALDLAEDGRAPAPTDTDPAEPADDAQPGEESIAGEPVTGESPVDEPLAEAQEADTPDAEAQEADAPAAAEALEADAAAAAEVAATEGLDLGAGTEWPAAVLSAARRGDPQDGADAPDGGATRLHVSGLTSVAGISALKGALGQLPGVHSVSVSSGERGVFVFAVAHDPSADLASGLAGLPGFAARITDATGDDVSVVAHEPAA